MNIIRYSIRSFFTNEYYSIIRFASKRLFVATLSSNLNIVPPSASASSPHSALQQAKNLWSMNVKSFLYMLPWLPMSIDQILTGYHDKISISWPVATIVGFDHCYCLIPILLWHLCIYELLGIKNPCSQNRSSLMLCLCVAFCNFKCLTEAKKCIAEYVYELVHFNSYCH